MTYLQESEKAGAAPTASDPLDTEIVTPVSLDNSNDECLPEESTTKVSAIDGAALLDLIRAFLRRFIVYPSEAASYAHVLWIGHTHLLPAFFTTPRLAVLSSDPGSGKSRLLEMTAMLVARAIFCVQSTPAYITRKIRDSEVEPTLLYDEIDTIFGPTARGSEDLRAVFNSGYRRGAVRGVCFSEKGKTYTEELPLFCPAALGGLGTLPETIMSRSIIFRMRKCLPNEKVETFRPAVHEPEAGLLFDELALWAASVLSQAKSYDPVLPDGVKDRNRDIWGPMTVVADLAGGRWPDIARAVAVELVTNQKLEAELPLGVRLLAEIRTCFGDRKQVSTNELIHFLLADDEAPWGDLSGKKIDARKLAGFLRPYGIKSDTIRESTTTCKGYKLESFHDAWKRYLPLDQDAVTPVPSVADSEESQECEDEQDAALRIGDGCDGSVPDPDSS